MMDVDFDPGVAPYAGDWIPRTTILALAAGVRQALGADASRVGIFFWPQNATTYVVGPDFRLTANIGMQIPSTGYPVIQYADWGSLVSGPWWAGVPFGGINTLVTEILYLPRNEPDVP